MGIKSDSLKKLANMGCNIHAYRIFDRKNINDLEDYCNNLDEYSVRIDSDNDTLCLPFYTNEKISFDEIRRYIRQECTAIVTQARRYDKHLIANIVVHINNDDIYVEWSNYNCPLRQMYSHTNKLNSAHGNISEKVKDFEFNTKRSDSHFIENVLNDVYNLKDKIDANYFEMTYYDIKCGIFDKNYVIWQTRKD